MSQHTVSARKHRGARLLRHARPFAATVMLGAVNLAFPLAPAANACSQPDTWSVAGAFDLAASGLLPPGNPSIPANTGVRSIPPSLLKAVGWVESGWRQYSASGHPLVSFDFGYGIMQITSGMAGAFGNVDGTIDPHVQNHVASNYTYNIAYGAQMLAEKWATTPRIGNADPTIVEDWYYALWAYNGWGWANNPNNPRFTRAGTPATDPATYPYQERVLYLVAHPPHDLDGNPLWQPVPVALPSRKLVGTSPGPLPRPNNGHAQPPPAVDSVYRPGSLSVAIPSSTAVIPVRLENTGTEPWPAVGSSQVQLTYHLLTADANPWKALSPFTQGVLAYGQGATPLPENTLPGHKVTVKVTVDIPSSPGSYFLVWDLEQGPGTWFSQEGVLPRAQVLTVAPTAANVVPTVIATPTRTPSLAENLQFIADTSFPDGSTLSVGQRFLKGWLVYNDGRTNWDSGWSLVLASGKSFGARRIPIPSVHLCHTLNIVAALRAPQKPGSYTSVWRLQDASGKPVGDKLTIVVRVVRPGGTTPTPTPVATPGRRATPTPPPVTPTPTPGG